MHGAARRGDASPLTIAAARLWELVARVERKRNPGTAVPAERPIPDFAEPVIGPAKGGTRWLNPGYDLPTAHRRADGARTERLREGAARCDFDVFSADSRS